MSLRDVNETYFCEGLVTGSVTASNGSIVVLGAEPFRKNLLFYNDAPGPVWIKYGGGAQTNNFSLKMAAGAYWEMPKPPYTGSMTAHWDAASGSLYYTQIS